MNQHVRFHWTDDNHAEAVEMWTEGRSITEIANFFSISRNSVAGHISRNRESFASRVMGRPVTQKSRKDGRVHTIWTDERLSAASKLWSEGRSTREIADIMGVSNSSMHDLAHRNRDRFPLRVQIKRKARAPKVDLKAVFDAAPSSSPYDGSRFILSGQAPVSFASLEPTHCKFPVSAPDEPCGPAMTCCGMPAGTGLSYCLPHHAIAHGRASS